MKCNNAIVENKLKSKVIEAEKYIGLPEASPNTAGIVRIDNSTIKINESGELYAEVNKDTSTNNSAIIDHIEEDIHLNNKRKEDLDVNMPNHMKSTDIHFTSKSQKENLFENVKILLEHLSSFHLSEEEGREISIAIDSLNNLLTEHMDNDNIHLSVSSFESITESINDILCEINTLKETSNKLKEKADRLENNKLNISGHANEKILGTDSAGNIVMLDINIRDLGAIAGTAEMLSNLVKEIIELNELKADAKTLKDHIENDEIHFTKDEKRMTLDRIEEIERNISEYNTKQTYDLATQTMNRNLRFRYIKDILVDSDNGDITWVNCEVSKGGVNIALNKTVTSNVAVNNIQSYTNGSTIETNDTKIPGSSILDGDAPYLMVDLGAIYSGVDYIRIHHGYSRGAKYNHILKGSVDGVEWFDIFNSNISGKYEEKEEGRLHILNFEHFSTGRNKAGIEGQVNFISETGTNKTKPGFTLYEGIFVFNSKELQEAKEKKTSFEEIFERWYRFSHNRTDNQPANEEETKAWVLDSENNRVLCTVNSNTHIGFISSDSYDSYIHEATVKSSANDNDMIGIIIAFTKDKEGIEHTLTAVRTAALDSHVNVDGNLTTQWAIVYNYGKKDAKVIASKSVAGDSQLSTWKLIPNGSRIRVERNENIIKATTSRLDDTTLLNETMLTVDLNSDSVLSIFKRPCKYGYSCHSQDASTFSDIFFSGGLNNIIYDLSKNEGWMHNGNSWVLDKNRKPYEDIGIGKFVYSPSLQRLSYIKDVDSFVHISINNNNSVSTYSASVNEKMSGFTKERPLNPYDGYGPWFDIDINKGIWYNKGKWVDVLGVEV